MPVQNKNGLVFFFTIINLLCRVKLVELANILIYYINYQILNYCYQIGNKYIYLYVMRVIAVKTLKEYGKEFHQAEQALYSWYDEAVEADWNNSAELKAHYKNASIINSKRVVFNIHGNSYRLIVDIEYRLKIVFVVWFGTHKQYDSIDVKTISYVKTN